MPKIAPLIIVLALISNSLHSQEMKSMHYNIMLYGNPFFCDENDNNTNAKDENIKTLINYVQPDIFTVNELGSGQLADRILDFVLNTDGVNSWARANSSNTFWDSGIVNMLYYNSDKYGLLEQASKKQAPDGTYLTRVIDIYTLYNKESAIANDTVIFHIILAHYHSSNVEMRTNMAQAVNELMSERGEGNYILSGDLNIDSSNEESFQLLIDNDDSSLNLYDPVNRLGSWHNNPSFEELHSQSTHMSGGGCFAGGGLDDRFDFTLNSYSVLNGLDGLTYIADSYNVFGNDGTNYNQSLHINNNAVVSSEIATALYELSDHLPIITEYSFDFNVGINDNETDLADINIYSTNTNNLTIQSRNELSLDLQVVDLQGRILLRESNFGKKHSLDISALTNSVYIISIRDKRSGKSINKRFAKTN